ncbi:glycosyltransferase family 4 protein [Candidatus Uhrbacteria bacterium]|nr:glycosyltransferase family 4 protein [Candidatus Uhrbacteria bacterium]
MNLNSAGRTRKRIGIDARLYHYGYGIGRYIQQLIAAFEKMEDTNEYMIFLSKTAWNLYQPLNPRFHKVPAFVPWYSLSEQLIMPFLIKKHRIDLMHFPHFNVPLFNFTPYIVTIHDLTMLTSPISARIAASTRSRIRYEAIYAAYRVVLHFAAARALHIISVSQSVKNDINARLHIPLERITVIYNGVMRPSAHAKRPDSIKKPFYLSVGSSYPHKNIERLVEAWSFLKKSGFPIPLVLCGQEDVFRDRIVSLIENKGLAASIIHLGMVTDEELSWLYANALGLISPSLAEGFGLPTVEALRYALPSIVSRLPVYEETIADCAVYFDPLNVNDMVKSIQQFHNDERMRNRLRAACLDRAALYDWSNTARQTYALYQSS